MSQGASHSQQQHRTSMGTTRSGAHGKLGYDYQTLVTLFGYHRGYHEGFSFELTAEKVENGIFDDIEVQLTAKDGRVNRLLLQIKNREKKGAITYDTLINGKLLVDENSIVKYKKLRLEKYFSWFKDNNQFLEDHDQFIIYTNMDFEEGFAKSCIEVGDDEVSNLKRLFCRTLCDKLNSPRFYRLEYNAKICKDMRCSTLDDMQQPAAQSGNDCSKLKKFLGKLIFAVNQPSTPDIMAIIQDELAVRYNLTNSRDVFDDLYGKMHQYVANTNNKCISWSDAKQHFDKLEEQLQISNLLGVHSPITTEWLDKGDLFNDMSSLSKLSTTQNTLILISSKSRMLSFIKVVQYFKTKMNVGDREFKLGFSAIDITSLQALKAQIKHSFQMFLSYCLIIQITQLEEKEFQILEDLLAFSIVNQSNQHKQLILIYNNYDDDKMCRLLRGQCCEYIEDRCEFQNVSASVQDCVKKKTVKFQGREVLMDKLFADISQQIQEEHLSKLFGGAFSIGKPLEQVNTLYIERQMMKFYELSTNVFFNASDNDLFVMSNITKCELSPLLRVGWNIFIVDESTDFSEQQIHVIILQSHNVEFFQKILKEFQNKNVYWFEKEGSRLKQIHPSYKEIDTVSIGTKVVVGGPGIGKSWVMTRIMDHVKSKNPHLWCKLIKLNNFSKELNEINFTDNQDDNINASAEFLVLTENLDDKKAFEKNVLKGFIKKGQVAIFLDGFDEIAPIYDDKVTKLIECLQQMNARHIWISSRLHCYELLTNHVKTTYCLTQISRDEQVDFLVAFWEKSFEEKELSINKISIRLYAKTLIETFLQLTFNGMKDMIGIPLQMRLLAEIYEEKCKEYAEKPEMPNEHLIDVVEIYIKFVEKKLKIFAKKKKKGNSANKYDIIDNKILRFQYINWHQNLALQLLLPNEVQSFVHISELTNDMKIVLLGIGIAKEINGRVHFIHRTFAEYFVAQFFVDIIKNRKSGKKHESALIFLKREFFKQSNDMLRFFMDHMLTTGLEIHTAIVKGNFASISNIVNAEPNNDSTEDPIFTKDPMGRLPFHLAASYEVKEGNVVKILIEKALKYEDGLTNMYIADKLNCQPISYAFLSSDLNKAVKDFIRLCHTLPQFFIDLSIQFPILHQRYSERWSNDVVNLVRDSKEFDEFLKEFSSEILVCEYELEQLELIITCSPLLTKIKILKKANFSIIKRAFDSGSLKTISWVCPPYPFKTGELAEVLDEIPKMVEYQNCFKRAAQNNDFSMLLALTACIDFSKAKASWEQQKYLKILQKAIENNLCNLAMIIFQVFENDLSCNVYEIVTIALQHRHTCQFSIEGIRWIERLKEVELKDKICGSKEFEGCFKNACQDKEFAKLVSITRCLDLISANRLWKSINYVEALEIVPVKTLQFRYRYNEERIELLKGILQLIPEKWSDIAKRTLGSQCATVTLYLSMQHSIVNNKLGDDLFESNGQKPNEFQFCMLVALSNFARGMACEIWEKLDFGEIPDDAVDSEECPLVKEMFEEIKDEISDGDYHLFKIALKRSKAALGFFYWFYQLKSPQEFVKQVINLAEFQPYYHPSQLDWDVIQNKSFCKKPLLQYCNPINEFQLTQSNEQLLQRATYFAVSTYVLKDEIYSYEPVDGKLLNCNSWGINDLLMLYMKEDDLAGCKAQIQNISLY